MKTRAYVMLGIALLLAGAAVFLARNWVQNQVQPVAAIEEKKQIETTQVIVASTQLHFGNKVRREHLRVVDWPAAAVPEGSFKSIDDILGKEEVDPKTGVKKSAEERTALRTIEINEPILKSKITGFGGRASLSTLIAPGMRATTIRVNDVSGVAGFVLPGDRVDILLTRDPEGGGRRGGNLQTDVFLQNMKVLAIAQDANQERNKAAVVKAVTLEVTPVQAQKLTLAQKLGALSLYNRNDHKGSRQAPVAARLTMDWEHFPPCISGDSLSFAFHSCPARRLSSRKELLASDQRRRKFAKSIVSQNDKYCRPPRLAIAGRQ